MLASSSKWCLSIGVAAMLGCGLGGCATIDDEAEEVAQRRFSPRPDFVPPEDSTPEGCEPRIWGGDAVIQGSDHMELLSGYTRITDRLTVVGDELTDLQGLECLGEVGSLHIRDNGRLESLRGLEGLVAVGSDLIVERNPQLASLDGLSSLTTVGGYVFIEENAALAQVDGLSSLRVVGADLVLGWNASLSSTDGFGALRRVGGLWVHANNSLTDLEGFFGLQTVLGILAVQHNRSLCSLGFDSLGWIGLVLRVVGNPALPSCDVDALISQVTYPDFNCFVTTTGNDDNGSCE